MSWYRSFNQPDIFSRAAITSLVQQMVYVNFERRRAMAQDPQKGS
jgi:hypothetical protein